MLILRAAIEGKAELGKVFWLLLVCITSALGLSSYGLASWEIFSPAWTVPPIACWLWFSVLSTWRCSGNTKFPGLGRALRFMMLLILFWPALVFAPVSSWRDPPGRRSDAGGSDRPDRSTFWRSVKAAWEHDLRRYQGVIIILLMILLLGGGIYIYDFLHEVADTGNPPVFNGGITGGP